MPIPTTRASSRTFGMWPALALVLFYSLLASLLDLLDLADNEPQPRQIALQLGQGIWRHRRALRGVHGCQTFGRLAQGWFEIANAQPGQRALHAVDKPRAFLDQALALPIGPLGILFGKRRHAHHAAMAAFPSQPPQEPPLEQFGVQPIGLGPSMFPRHRHTRGMDHVRFYPSRLQPARQPEAVAAGFEGQRNPGDSAAGPNRLIPPAMQQGKQPFWARFQFLAGLTLNAGNDTANQPARLAQLDDGNDRAILVQGDEGSAQVVRLGHRGTPSVRLQRRSCHVLAARPIESSGSAREALSRFDLLRRHLLRKGRCAHEEHYIFPMRTPTTHRSRPKARPSYGSRDPSPRRASAALPIGILALVFAMVGAIAVRAEVISVPSTDPPSSAASLPPPTVLRGSPPNTARS